MNLAVPNSNTVSTQHTYTIDWKPDYITWSIDGQPLRTKFRNETWNSTSNRYDFPQTPARVMLSLWPAGLPSNAPGTIAWAGGLVDWSSQYMQNGYYYAQVSEVTVECYNPPQGANVQGKKSYVYTSAAGTNDTVAMTDQQQVLASFYATGENPGTDPNASKSSSTKTATASSTASTSAEPETVPGMSGAGSRGDSNSVASVAGTAATAAAGSGSATTGSSNNGGGSSGFQQGDTTRSGASAVKEKGVVGGSIFAVVVAVVGLIVL